MTGDPGMFSKFSGLAWMGCWQGRVLHFCSCSGCCELVEMWIFILSGMLPKTVS